MKISVSVGIAKGLSGNSSYIVIPFLESSYKKYGKSVFKMINHGYVMLNDKYKDACSAIDAKLQDNMINIATLTVALDSVATDGSRDKIFSKRTKKVSSARDRLHSKRNLNILGSSLIQIYLVRIDSGDIIIKKEDRKEKYNKNAMLEELRVGGHLIFTILKGNFIRNVNIFPILEDGDVACKPYILALLEGLMLSAYKFDKYKTDKALERVDGPKHEYHLEGINLIINKICKFLADDIARLETIVASVFLARDLVNEPANERRVARFMNRVGEFIKKMGVLVELEVWDKAQLEKMGMGLHLGVGKGSSPENAPCMLVIKYSGTSKDNISPEWVLLGKGITFDTGGINLKSSKYMLDMKSDLSGAAAVVSFLLGYAASGGERCIYAMCPFAENSIGSSAVKPSDILKAYDGRTVEVVNTDAEGRLILADALAYVVRKWPTARVMDLATLTGQAEDVSGKAFSCVLSVNAEKETRELITKSEKINEMLVRLPLLEKESSKLESDVADIKNITYKSSADIIMSGLFMKEFIKPDTKWIHVDIAGPAFEASEVVIYASPEASGVGVRLLFEYFAR